MIDYLNKNFGFIQTVSTIVLVVITGYYAWQTKKTVKIMKDTEKERNRPRVEVFIKQQDDCINLVNLFIGNYGNSIAKDIKFFINKDIELNLGNKSLSSIIQIKDGIKNLVPGRELVIPFISLVGTLDKFKKNDIVLKVEYSDIENNKFKESFVLDITNLIENQIGQSPLYNISKNLEDISNSLKKIKK